MDQSINFVIETKLRETKPIIIELRSLTAQPIKIHVLSNGTIIVTSSLDDTMPYTTIRHKKHQQQLHLPEK